MTEHQIEEVYDVLTRVMYECGLDNITPELHHGDCVGVDVQAAIIAKELGYKIICHPPAVSEQQGHFGGDVIRKPSGYLQRDRAIVDECDALLVVPLQMERQSKGGTWYTHDYAKKKNKPYIVLWPRE